MQMATANENHEKLRSLTGTWRGKERIHPTPWDPKGGEAEGETTSRLDLGDTVVITDYIQKRGGQINYRGHGVYGWDDKRQKYIMYWFDTMSGARFMLPAEGSWEGKTLTFLNQGDMGWGRYTYHFDSPEKQRFSIEMSQDGREWSKFMEGEYTRT